MKRGTPRHPKFLHALAVLGGDDFELAGRLEFLWHFAAEYAIDGAIGKWPNAAIANACRWKGDADEFVVGLVTTGWLDEHPSPQVRLLVHDWPHHADRAVHGRLVREKRWFADGTAPDINAVFGDERKEARPFYEKNEPPSSDPPARVPTREPHGDPPGAQREPTGTPCVVLRSPPSPPLHSQDKTHPPTRAGAREACVLPAFGLARELHRALVELVRSVDPKSRWVGQMRDEMRADADARQMLDLATAGITPDDLRSRWAWLQANRHRNGCGFRVRCARDLAEKWDAIGDAMEREASRDENDPERPPPRQERARCRWHEEVDVRLRFGELAEHEASREHELLERQGVRRCDDGQAFADRYREAVERERAVEQPPEQPRRPPSRPRPVAERLERTARAEQLSDDERKRRLLAQREQAEAVARGAAP